MLGFAGLWLRDSSRFSPSGGCTLSFVEHASVHSAQV